MNRLTLILILLVLCKQSVSQDVRIKEDNGFVFLFSFDSTKIFVRDINLSSVLLEKNKKSLERDKYSSKSDTIEIIGYHIYSDQRTDGYYADLNSELLELLYNRKTEIQFKNQPIAQYYSKKKVKRHRFKKTFENYLFFNKQTKDHFLTIYFDLRPPALCRHVKWL